MSRFRILLVAILAAFLAPVAAADTTITYQGTLEVGATPATGTFEMAFGLWDAAVDGAPVGAEITLPAVEVLDGGFVVELDFGAEAIGAADDPRWLEITVESVTLDPRQRLRPAPFSLNMRAVHVDAGGNVGIGTAAPAADLHVQEGSAGAVTPYQNSVAAFERAGSGYVSMLTPDSAERGLLFGDPESPVNGGIIYNNPSTRDGLEFRTGGNRTRLAIDALGHASMFRRLAVNSAWTAAQAAVVTSSGAPSAVAATSAGDAPTIAALNEDVGPALQLVGTGEVSPSSDGILVIGYLSDANIAIDRNEITARFNGTGATLFVNADGGDVLFGDNRVKPPLAYGSVFRDGALITSSGNVIAYRASRGSYRIAVNEWVNVGDVIQVAPRPIQENGVGYRNATAVPVPADGLITVLVSDEDGQTVDCTFSFVIHRP